MVPFTPTEVGTHLPTSKGWRAELAQVGRLHQTFDKSKLSWTCLDCVHHRPLSGSNSSRCDGLCYKTTSWPVGTSALPTELSPERNSHRCYLTSYNIKCDNQIPVSYTHLTLP